MAQDVSCRSLVPHPAPSITQPLPPRPCRRCAGSSASCSAHRPTATCCGPWTCFTVRPCAAVWATWGINHNAWNTRVQATGRRNARPRTCCPHPLYTSLNRFPLHPLMWSAEGVMLVKMAGDKWTMVRRQKLGCWYGGLFEATRGTHQAMTAVLDAPRLYAPPPSAQVYANDAFRTAAGMPDLLPGSDGKAAPPLGATADFWSLFGHVTSGTQDSYNVSHRGRRHRQLYGTWHGQPAHAACLPSSAACSERSASAPPAGCPHCHGQRPRLHHQGQAAQGQLPPQRGLGRQRRRAAALPPCAHHPLPPRRV